MCIKKKWTNWGFSMINVLGELARIETAIRQIQDSEALHTRGWVLVFEQKLARVADKLEELAKEVDNV